MKYELQINAPSLTVNFFEPRTKGDKRAPVRKSIELKNGEGSLRGSDFDSIKQLPIVHSLVAEGQLRFRESEEMEELFGTERDNYEARLAAMQDQDDRRDNPPQSEDIAELTRLVGEMQATLAQQEERNSKEIADLQKQIAAKPDK